jgi:hypothetical protein
MPHGKGTYGSKVGRPPKKDKLKSSSKKSSAKKMKRGKY